VRTTRDRVAPPTRLATPADRAAIAEFCRATWGPGSEDYIEHVLDDWMTRADGALAVAEVDGRAAACCHVRLLSAREAFLAGMRVDPGRRRSGLSVALTEYCVRWAAERGRSIVRVIIGWNNTAALGAIARAGFRQTGSVTLWERDGVDTPALPEGVTRQLGRPLPGAPAGALWAIGWMVRELTDADIAERARAGWALRSSDGLALLRPSDDYLWLAWLSGPAPARVVLGRAAIAAAAAAGRPRCRALLASDPATDRALEAAGFARGLEYRVYSRTGAPPPFRTSPRTGAG
jgi:GNAT superfamily N-acetyltransferase